MSKIEKFFNFFLALTILALPFYIFRFTLGPIPSTLLEVLIFITFILALFGGRFKKQEINKPIFWGSLFILAALLAVAFDSNKIAALGIWKAYFFDGILFFAVLLALNQSERERVKKILILSGALTSALAIGLYLSGTKTIDGRLLDLDQLSPNYLAMYLVPIFILNISEITRSKEKVKLICMIIVGFIIAAAIYLTNSRAGYISTLAGLIVLGYGWAKGKLGKKLSVVSVIVLLLALIGGSAWFFKPVANDLGRTGASSNIRDYIWSTSLEIVKQNPITGIGLNNYQNYFSQYTKGWTNFDEFITPEAHTAHNLYLHIYLTTGLAGFVAFIALMISSRFWRAKDIALIASLASILIFSLFDTPFFRNDLAVLFWMILALVYVQKGTEK